MNSYLIVLGVFFILDTAFTLYGLNHGSTEQNRFLLPLIKHYGPRTALVLVKAISFAIALYYAAGISKNAQAITLALYAGVVTWNLLQIAKGKA